MSNPKEPVEFEKRLSKLLPEATVTRNAATGVTTVRFIKDFDLDRDPTGFSAGRQGFRITNNDGESDFMSTFSE